MDVLPDQWTTVEQIRLHPVDGVGGPIALIAEIAAWPPRRTLLGEGVNEADVDDIEICFITEMTEALLVRTLTLKGELATTLMLHALQYPEPVTHPVNGHIGR